MSAPATDGFVPFRAPSAYAYSQLSAEDKKLVEHLKRTYPQQILESIFQDESTTDRVTRWNRERADQRSSIASSAFQGSLPELTSSAASVVSTNSAHTVGECHLTDSMSLTRAMSREKLKSKRQRAKQYQPRNMGHPAPPPARPPPSPPKEDDSLLYYCTHCEQCFEDKSKWKYHEGTAHIPQFYWPCSSPGCKESFENGNQFERHHKNAHGCKNCNHAAEAKSSIPIQRVWGCGITQCIAVFNSWDERCEHIAAHFEELARQGDDGQPMQWTYTTMISNLLRQPYVQDAYRSLMVRCHGELRDSWPRMGWQPGNSQALKCSLERRDFHTGGAQEVARLAYQLGHPNGTDALRILAADSVRLEKSQQQQTQQYHPPTTQPPTQPPPQPPATKSSTGKQHKVPKRHHLQVPPPTPHHYLFHPSAPNGSGTQPALPHLPASPMPPQWIDKFPQVGKSPWEVYGQAPPSPIIQLDFFSHLSDDENAPRPVTGGRHKQRSSVSNVCFSLDPEAAEAPAKDAEAKDKKQHQQPSKTIIPQHPAPIPPPSGPPPAGPAPKAPQTQPPPQRSAAAAPSTAAAQEHPQLKPKPLRPQPPPSSSLNAPSAIPPPTRPPHQHQHQHQPLRGPAQFPVNLPKLHIVASAQAAARPGRLGAPAVQAPVRSLARKGPPGFPPPKREVGALRG